MASRDSTLVGDAGATASGTYTGGAEAQVAPPMPPGMDDAVPEPIQAARHTASEGDQTPRAHSAPSVRIPIHTPVRSASALPTEHTFEFHKRSGHLQTGSQRNAIQVQRCIEKT